MPASARLLAASILATGALSSGAHAAPVGVTLDVGAQLLRQPPGRAWAIGLDVGAAFTAVDGGKPPALTRAVLRFPHATLNAGRFPTCSLTRLKAKGPDGCPAGSRIGTGTSVIDARPIVMDPLDATLTLFNGPRHGAARHLEMRAFVPSIGYTLDLDATLRRLSGRYGYALTLTIPPIQTLTGLPDVSIDSFAVTVRAVRGGISFVEAPRSCPAGGLPFAGTFDFAGGASVQAASAISCTLTAEARS